jgi:hypothetical protein
VGGPHLRKNALHRPDIAGGDEEQEETINVVDPSSEATLSQASALKVGTCNSKTMYKWTGLCISGRMIFRTE